MPPTPPKTKARPPQDDFEQSGPGAAMRGLLDEQKRKKRRRRRIRALVIVAVAVVLFYLAVTSFVFDPLEGSIVAFQNAVPRASDFFVRKTNIGDELPYPETILTPTSEASVFRKPLEEGKLGVPRETVRAILDGWAKLEKSFEGTPIDPVRDLVGREVVLAGIFPDKGSLAASRFGAYFRVSWRVRAALGLARYEFLRKRFLGGLALEPRSEGIFRFVPPGGGRELFLSRNRDLVIVASDEAWIREANDLITQRGEGSFGQSSNFNDEIANTLNERRGARSSVPPNLQLYVRLEPLRRLAGSPKPWPEAGSPVFEERWLAGIFNTATPRDVSALIRFEKEPRRSIIIDAFFDLDTSGFDSIGKRIYSERPLTKRDLRQMGEMVPQSAFAGGAVVVPGGELARHLEATLAVEDRRAADTAFRNTGKYDSLRALCDDFSLGVGERAIFVLRENVYPKMEKDPPNDGGPDPAVAVSFPQRSFEKIQQIKDYFRNNKQAFGIQEIFTFTVQGNHEWTEFTSPVVPGTGELAVLPVGRDDKGEVILSNQAKLLDNIHKTWRLTALNPDKPYAEDPLFKEWMTEQENRPMNAVAWVIGPKLAKLLRSYVPRWIGESTLYDPEKARAERDSIFKEVLKEKYPKYTPQDVPAKERAEVDNLVDARMREKEKAAARSASPELKKRYEEIIKWVEAVPGVFVAARLEPKHAALYVNVALE